MLKIIVIQTLRTLLIAMTFLVHPAYAAPDAGTLQRTLPKKKIEIPKTKDLVEETPKEEGQAGPTIVIKLIKFKGNTLIPSDELQGAVKDYINQKLNMSDLNSIRLRVGEYYRTKGWWATTIYEDQEIDQGSLVITIYEGRVGQILLEPKSEPLRFPKERAKMFISNKLSPGDPIKILELDQAIADLDAIPGITSKLKLEAGELVGETDLIIDADNTPLLDGSFLLDNQGSRSTGYGRGLLTLNLNSPLSQGEQFNINVLKTDYMDYFGASANYPLLDDGTKISYSYTTLEYTLGFPLQDIGGKGKANSSSLTLTRPIFRTTGVQITGDIGLTHNSYYNYASSTTTSNKTIDGVVATANLQSQDTLFGGGLNVGSLSLKSGRLDLSDYADDYDTDSSTFRTNGHFDKLNMTYIRIQPLTASDNLWLNLSGQYALNKNLDSGEKMSLGGGTGVRAYPTAEASGDIGMVVQVELRHTFTPTVQATAFYDFGHIQQYKKTYDGWNDGDTTIPNRYSLQGVGLGVIWQALENTQVDASIAAKVGGNKGADENGYDGDTTNHSPRIWVGMTSTF